MTIEMDRLLTILIDYFGQEGQIKVAEELEGLRDGEQLGTAINLLAKEYTYSWKVGDTVRLQEKHWSHSKGIKGAIGRIEKVNLTRCKVRFAGRLEIVHVPKNMLERV